VRLIDEKGEQRGIVATVEALDMARRAGLDLVEVSRPRAPRCASCWITASTVRAGEKAAGVQEEAEAGEAQGNPHAAKIEEHDLGFKTKHIQEFLSEGFKVKVTVRFRGRELAHTELGRNVLNKVLEVLGDTFLVDKPPVMEGRMMSMFLSPKGKK